ncbi:MAG: family 10 glycosylhydrolase, partial [Clostridia bacterium]
DPYTKFSRDLVLNLYKEMLQKYKIDGLHLDYIRFSEPNPNGNDFGYNDDIIKGFQSKYKTSIDPHIITATHPLWKDWCKFREEIINSFVKEVYDMVQDVNPEIHISSACYPEFQKMPVWNFQNYRDWVDKGYMDEIFSMSYGADVAYPVNNAKDFINAIGGRCFYSIGVCAFDKTQSDILLQQMFQAKQAGASGENAFSWGSLIIHKYNYYDALKSGLYSKPSVQLYKYSKTVSAGMQRLISDLSEIYEYLAPEYKNAYSEIKSRADEILKNANSFEVDNATADQKRAYCKSASKQLLDFNEYIKNESKITNDNLKNALTSDITVLINALKTSIVRLEH